MTKAIHNDALILIAFLKDTKPGQLIPWDDISNAIGQDVRDAGAPRLATARRVLLREDNMVFRAYKDDDGNRGLERCTDAGTVDVIGGEVRRMLRTSGRTLQKVATVNEKKLSEDERRRLFVLSAQAGVVRQFCGAPAQRRLAKVQESGPKQISLAETIAQFTNGSE